jgi:hypothetical protein
MLECSTAILKALAAAEPFRPTGRCRCTGMTVVIVRNADDVGLSRFDGHPQGLTPGRMADHGERGEQAPAPSHGALPEVMPDTSDQWKTCCHDE